MFWKTRGRQLFRACPSTFAGAADQPDAAEINKLAQAVEKVAAKGSRSSLLLYKDLAFVAGVQSRTIITALDGESRKEHIFTNIDSAVIVG